MLDRKYVQRDKKERRKIQSKADKRSGGGSVDKEQELE
jgi:hypothetical protein